MIKPLDDVAAEWHPRPWYKRGAVYFQETKEGFVVKDKDYPDFRGYGQTIPEAIGDLHNHIHEYLKTLQTLRGR